MPLNTKQLSRGMLNYTFFQHYPDWKKPFWAFKQYDPDYIGFIPRSHLGVSMNVTHRNWTAIGNMNCDIEPIVDPRGSVVPFVDGWSLECWIKYKGDIIIPAHCKEVKQKLVDDLPIVETNVIEKDFSLCMNHYTVNDVLVCEYEIENYSKKSDLKIDKEVELILAVRPFNFEGVSPIDSIYFDQNDSSLFINSANKINFNRKPDGVILSNLKSADCANLLLDGDQLHYQKIINCEYGFANAVTIFNLNNIPGDKKRISAQINLRNNHLIKPFHHSKGSVKKYWQDILNGGSKLIFTDERISSLFKSSLITSLQFIDGDKVTPGPAIYHQFWFRDAAFQLNILDKLGYTAISRNVITTFFNYQKNDGYYQSQKGEWDSNGQVLWLITQHALLSNDITVLRENFLSIYNAVKWIDKNRMRDKKYLSEKYYGLLPKGLSAEHLGLADNYYWDNFWAIAGIKSFILVCELLHETKPKQYSKNLLDNFEQTLRESITASIKSNQYSVLPSAPSKALDSGMIGSLTAIYPLQILDWEKETFINSLDYVHKNYFHRKLFFQDIIHSGGNPYITIQIAHSYLLLGNRDLFNKEFNDVVSYASPTLNYPEAIHPLTGGGVIGDGHHGWAAAEVLSSIRDVFVYEKNYYSVDSIELILLSGVSKERFKANTQISLINHRVLCGVISISCSIVNNSIELIIDFKSNKYYKNEFIIIVLPFIVNSFSSSLKELSIFYNNSETSIRFNAGSLTLSFDI